MATSPRAFDIIITGHSVFPCALLETAEMICGKQIYVRAISLRADMSPESYTAALRAAITPDRPTLILCDLVGGTPFNEALSLARQSNLLVIMAGVNLAMALEALLSEGALDADLVERLLAVGREGVVEAARMRARRSQ
jgi:PTS system N-acetylgalactosamine-specific IIA component